MAVLVVFVSIQWFWSCLARTKLSFQLRFLHCYQCMLGMIVFLRLTCQDKTELLCFIWLCLVGLSMITSWDNPQLHLNCSAFLFQQSLLVINVLWSQLFGQAKHFKASVSYQTLLNKQHNEDVIPFEEHRDVKIMPVLIDTFSARWFCNWKTFGAKCFWMVFIFFPPPNETS